MIRPSPLTKSTRVYRVPVRNAHGASVHTAPIASVTIILKGVRVREALGVLSERNAEGELATILEAVEHILPPGVVAMTPEREQRKEAK